MKKQINEKTETLAVFAVGILIALVAIVAFFILLPAVLSFFVLAISLVMIMAIKFEIAYNEKKQWRTTKSVCDF